MTFRNYPVKDALGTSDYLLTIDRTNRGISMVAVANLLGIDTSTPAASGEQQVFIQSTQPEDTGSPYIWIQTGLPGGGWSVWFNETGTT